jgi:integrase
LVEEIGLLRGERQFWRGFGDGSVVVEKNLRPSFGKVRAARLSTDLMDRYREKRTGEGRTDATVNRELSIMRTAFHNARKRTPPKVNVVPYFPMVKETTVRKGFLTDKQYADLRDALLQELKPLFVCGYVTGIRKGELTDIQWPQLDWSYTKSVLPSVDPMIQKKRTSKAWSYVSAIFSRLASICRGFTKTFHVSGTSTLGTASRSDRSSESH